MFSKLWKYSKNPLKLLSKFIQWKIKKTEITEAKIFAFDELNNTP